MITKMFNVGIIRSFTIVSIKISKTQQTIEMSGMMKIARTLFFAKEEQ